MKKQNMKPLDLNSGWEKVVNPKTAQRREEARQVVQKWLQIIYALLAVILLNLLLWVVNVMPTTVSLVITGGCGCVGCFLTGRLYEACSR